MARDWKEKHGFVGKPWQKVEVMAPIAGRPTKLDITQQMKAASESILEPVSETMLDLLPRIDPEFQEQVRESIILSGGSSQIGGFRKVLQEGPEAARRRQDPERQESDLRRLRRRSGARPGRPRFGLGSPFVGEWGSADPRQVSDRLAELRESIAEVDRSLLELLRRRMDLAAEVGRVKLGAGKPILVPEVHNRVLTRARQHADSCEVSPEVKESIFQAVMRGSIERQHRVGVNLRAEGGSRLLILGGAGDMGNWSRSFAQLLGHPVDIVDPVMKPLPAVEGRYGSLDEVEDLDRCQAIVVSVPLGRTAEVLDQLTELEPRRLVIEIASIKHELMPALERGRAAGLKISSLHPMFGPRKSPYEELTFVLAYREDPHQEQEWIEEWIRHPYTHLVPVPFDHHDRLMGWLLGFAHLSGMLFGCALTRSGLGAEELAACTSTSFTRQSGAALHVLLEDPDLYYDIQRLNPHRGDVYQAAQEALEHLVTSVQDGDREGFRGVLADTRKLLVTER